MSYFTQIMEPKIQFNTAPLPLDDIAALTKDQNIIKMYANGFQSQLTLGDANIILKQNNASIGVLILSLSAVKSLHTQLGLIMESYTKSVGEEILSFEELLAKAQKKNLSDGK